MLFGDLFILANAQTISSVLHVRTPGLAQLILSARVCPSFRLLDGQTYRDGRIICWSVGILADEIGLQSAGRLCYTLLGRQQDYAQVFCSCSNTEYTYNCTCTPFIFFCTKEATQQYLTDPVSASCVNEETHEQLFFSPFRKRASNIIIGFDFDK